VIAANEGGAIGLAAGYHLSTGKSACVYLQVINNLELWYIFTTHFELYRAMNKY